MTRNLLPRDKSIEVHTVVCLDILKGFFKASITFSHCFSSPCYEKLCLYIFYYSVSMLSLFVRIFANVSQYVSPTTFLEGICSIIWADYSTVKKVLFFISIILSWFLFDTTHPSCRNYSHIDYNIYKLDSSTVVWFLELNKLNHSIVISKTK